MPMVRTTPEPERPAARRPSTDAGASSSRNMAWVILWVGLGLAVGLWVAATRGRSAATEYFAAYLLEESLSVEKIFVLVVILAEFGIPAGYECGLRLFGLDGALVFGSRAF